MAGWCAAIFWLSSRPGDDISPFMPALPHADKLLHAGAFGVGAWLARRALRRRPRLRPDVATVAALAFTVVYGLSDELHQALGDAGRSADPLDLLADTVGAAVAVCLAHLHEARRARRTTT